MDRDSIQFKATHEDTLRQQAYQQMREDKERKRLEKMREEDERMERQYRKINQKLLIHK